MTYYNLIHLHYVIGGIVNFMNKREVPAEISLLSELPRTDFTREWSFASMNPQMTPEVPSLQEDLSTQLAKIFDLLILNKHRSSKVRDIT